LELEISEDFNMARQEIAQWRRNSWMLRMQYRVDGNGEWRPAEGRPEYRTLDEWGSYIKERDRLIQTAEPEIAAEALLVTSLVAGAAAD
jgi:hypothetical protein